MTTGPQHLAAPPESRDDDPLVSTLMAIPIVAITPDAPVTTALDLMAATAVRHLPVFEGHRCCGLVVEADRVDAVLVTDQHRLGGIVTASDLIRSLAGRPPSSQHLPGVVP
jgi:CBS domain-containing protein